MPGGEMLTEGAFAGLEDSSPPAPASEAEVADAPEGEGAAGAGTQEADVEESFFDINTVPPDLMPAYKQMQAAFTKGRQKDSGAAKRVAELEAELPKLKQAEEALRRIVVDPEYRSLVFAAAGVASPQQQAAAQDGWHNPYDVDVAELEDKSQKQVKHLAAEAGRELFLPALQYLGNELASVKKQLALAEMTPVVAERPDAQTRIQEFASFIADNPKFFVDRPWKERFSRFLRTVDDPAPAPSQSTPNKPAPNGNGTRNNAERKAAQVARPALPAANAKPANGKRTVLEILKSKMAEDGITL